MLLRKAVTRDDTGAVCFEQRYAHDALGRLHTSEWVGAEGSSGVVVFRSYDKDNRVVALLTTKPVNTLVQVEIFSRDQMGRPLSRFTFGKRGALLGRIEYRWQANGEGSAQSYDKGTKPRGGFRLIPTPGALYQIEGAAADGRDAAPGISAIRHTYKGNVIESTEIDFRGENVVKRVIQYQRKDGILNLISIRDEPSGRQTLVELEWTEGQSVLDTEREFLMDHLQLS